MKCRFTWDSRMFSGIRNVNKDQMEPVERGGQMLLKAGFLFCFVVFFLIGCVWWVKNM